MRLAVSVSEESVISLGVGKGGVSVLGAGGCSVMQNSVGQCR